MPRKKTRTSAGSRKDVLLVLRSVNGSLQETPQAHSHHRWLWIPAAALLAAIAALAGWLVRAPEPRKTYRVSIDPPESTDFIPYAARQGGNALSPDGTMLAFVGRTAGKVQLWVRRLDSLISRPMPGTESAYAPFWSPDSRSIGFFAGGRLKRIDIADGAVQIVCNTRGIAGTWSSGNVILFSDRTIWRVPAAGGEPVAITQLDTTQQEFDHSSPWFLPDGEHFVYTAFTPLEQDRGIYVASLHAPGDRKKVVSSTSSSVYAPLPGPELRQKNTGHLLFSREGTLMGQPFDASKHEVTGDAFPIAERLRFFVTVGTFSVSDSGLLAYNPGLASQRLVWRDRLGRQLTTVGEPANYGSPSVAPDGKRLAFGRREGTNFDIWIQDAARGTVSRFTTDPGIDSFSLWSADGNAIVFGGSNGIFRKAASGAGEAERLSQSAGPVQSVSDWSQDGRLVAVNLPDANIGVLALGGDGARVPLVVSQFDESHARFAPNSAGPPRWFAYDSDESGTFQVYVQAFTPGKPASGPRWQVSTKGGSEPRWRADGKELYFLSPDGRLMAVSVKIDGATFEAGTPLALFETSARSNTRVGWAYDVTRDGERFILLESAGAPQINLLINWQAALSR